MKTASEGKVIIYQIQSGEPEIQVTFENETLWLSQRAMAELFDKDTDTIGLHIKNIYVKGELNETVQPFFLNLLVISNK